MRCRRRYCHNITHTTNIQLFNCTKILKLFRMHDIMFVHRQCFIFIYIYIEEYGTAHNQYVRSTKQFQSLSTAYHHYNLTAKRKYVNSNQYVYRKFHFPILTLLFHWRPHSNFCLQNLSMQWKCEKFN